MLHRSASSSATGHLSVIDIGPVSALARTRFRSLVQSPLRAGILRYVSSQPSAHFDVESLMRVFGRLRIDIDNCVQGLLHSGVIRGLPGAPTRYQAAIPTDPDLARQLEDFLADRPAASIEDRSPTIQRFHDLIGRDEKMMLVFESMRTVAKTELSVLILGATGSGKDVVARVLHELSSRRHETLQTIDCAALPESEFESDAFGYERGVQHSGTYERKPGRMERANRGTLFLDEVGALSLVSQGALLRVVEHHRVERAGSGHSTDLDVRLICATSRPLDAMVSQGDFREDLYYRVNGFTIRLPALRERTVDIPVLADRVLARYCAANGLPPDALCFATDATDRLMDHVWPGNIRELETTVSRAARTAHDGVVRAQDIRFLPTMPTVRQPASAVLVPLREIEGHHIKHVLDAVHWNKKRAAQVLEISRETLYRKIAEFGWSPESRS
jgi:DNA-binding NtrC family response regulator